MTEEWVYLDANVVIDLSDAFGPTRLPDESEMNDLQRRQLAAARLFLYSHPRRPPHWCLASSESVRAELIKGEARSWMDNLLSEVSASDCDPALLVSETKRIEGFGIDTADAEHLANACLRPWFSLFVTNDKKLCKRGRDATEGLRLEVITSMEAEARLSILPGEPLEIVPARSNPLWGQTWWEVRR